MLSLIYLSLQGQCAAVTTHSLLIINITSPLPLFTPLFLTIPRLSSSPYNNHHAVPVKQAGPTAESVKCSGWFEHNEDKPRVCIFHGFTSCTV